MSMDLRVYLRVITEKSEIHTPLIINNKSEKFRRQGLVALNKLIKAVPREQRKNFYAYAQDLPEMQGNYEDLFDELGNRKP